jgi:CRISPR/Cas system-associated exonuclease Cas4 (RecB family)
MKQIVTYDFKSSFIGELTAYLEENYLKRGRDLTRLAVVFGGKRPALFLKKELSRKVGQSFFPPAFFAVDEFVDYLLRKSGPFQKPSDLDAGYLVYHLAKKATPKILKSRETFAAFLPWAREILGFIEMLDLEDISSKSLHNIELNAQIGYAIPRDINTLLEHLISLREACHRQWDKDEVYPRGFRYLKTAQAINDIQLKEFDEILFCNFFYFHQTEAAIAKSLYDRGQAVFLFQGDQDRWPVLKKTAGVFGCSIKPEQSGGKKGAVPFQGTAPTPTINLHRGFDVHSQVCLVREILKTIKDKDKEKTVIVLPDPDHVIPLLSEITDSVTNFNISMGYPLKRSSLYALLEFVMRAQRSRKNDEYYTRDYLKALRHPFIKNLQITGDATVTRVLIHKLEEILTGQEKTPLSGSLFIRLDDVEEEENLYLMTTEILTRMGIEPAPGELKKVVRHLHELVFRSWSQIRSFSDCCAAMGDLVETLIRKSFLQSYPLNLKIAERILAIKDEFETAAFNREDFPPEDIFRILLNKIDNEMVAFLGSPLKGLQVLGLFETRSLNFENVIVMDVNEGVLPRLRIYEPLIPREVLVSLGLDRFEKEEEIQRYQFSRLIASAKNVHLVYQESKDKERSRFIEELIWEEQKKTGNLEAGQTRAHGFAVKITPKTTAIQKTPEILEFLKNFTYSVSSINTYLRCPLQFYYKYVLGLKETEDLLDEPETREVGIFVHELLEDTFRPFIGQKPVIDGKFRNCFQKLFEERFDERFGKLMKSEAFLLKNVLQVRLKQFLDKEERAGERELRNVTRTLALEERFDDLLDLSCGPIKFVYKMDRIDRLEDGSVLVLDYKTGGVDLMPRKVEAVEAMPLERTGIRDTVRSFQVPMYFYHLTQKYPGERINAAFYNLRTMELKSFLNPKEAAETVKINEVFFKALDFILREILDPKIPFQPDDADPRYCGVCPFYHVCR